jgi:hypothetical protein
LAGIGALTARLDARAPVSDRPEIGPVWNLHKPALVGVVVLDFLPVFPFF